MTRRIPHVLGAALAAIALGPWCGMLTMALVLTAQCLLFGDGGTSTLGANILNMAVAGTLVASVLYALVTRHVAGARASKIRSPRWKERATPTDSTRMSFMERSSRR